MAARVVAAVSVLLAVVAAQATKPHIVFFLADDIGWNNVSQLDHCIISMLPCTLQHFVRLPSRTQTSSCTVVESWIMGCR